ncbi:AAA-domain-containing protein [Auriscalpium vulgare]|uniref:AAA-domain-containing protein n=1 Tax=Auriscalpium vulgare TaxID=40419 RepID=A0ACB8RIM5_9AGAM|nr:AAA-domain-containing protein [Auriscalpium vulgare]
MVSARGVPVALDFRPQVSLTAPDTVLLGGNLWNQIAPSALNEHRIPVSIAPTHRTHAGTKSSSSRVSPLSSLTCWALLGDEADIVIVPLEWTRLYGRIFHPCSAVEKTHVISSPRLIPLDDIFVQALSSEAYAFAKEHIAAFEDWFCLDQRILRQSSSYAVDHTALRSSSPETEEAELYSTLDYKLVMTEPVLQGFARKGQTSFILLPPDDGVPLVNGHSIAPASSSNLEEQSAYSDDDDLEIHEDFLASSMGRQLGTSHPGLNGSLAAVNGNGHATTPTISPHQSFSAEPLTGDVHATADEHTLYVRTADLSKIGSLDGDWAIVSSSLSTNRRLVRLESNDRIVRRTGTLQASPVLLHNIGGDSIIQSQIFVQAAPDYLSGRSLPTAKAVTIARVASKLSTNRIYQPLVLHGLKAFFEGRRRFIRQGDLLAVNVDVEQLQVAPYHAPAEQIIYFVVTNVDCDPSTAAKNTATSDLSVGVAVGELGCWVDPAVTRMLQTGTEHTRIPDGTGYLGLVALSSQDEEGNGEQNNQRAFRQIYGLVEAALMPQALSYNIPISILLKGARGIGKFMTATQVAQRLGMHVFEVNCYDFLGETDAETEGFLRARFEQAVSCSPCIFVMRHIDAFTQTTQGSEPGNEPAIIKVLQDLLKDLYGSWRLTGYPILVFGTTSEPGRVPPGLLSCFKHEAAFEAPGESERSAVLTSLLSNKDLAPDVSIMDLARRTAAFVAGDLNDLVTRTSFTAMKRAIRALSDYDFSPSDIFTAGIALTKSDFDLALDEARSSYSQNIGAPSIPNVTWDDVGGLADVKADILDTVQLPLEHPELFAGGLKKRSGILLYGPPGTGKTLLAKAVATSCSLNFFSVKGPELLNMYIGESEANVRRVFQRARDARPCVIFFDELDSVAPKRGNHGDSGGVMDRIVSQLLAELDGVAAGEGGDVFVIGATNRPDLLDAALLRPGRFDRMLYLGVSDTDLAQLKILQALTRKFRLDPELDLMTIAQLCPFNFTGADFYALCSDALLKAMTRKAEEIDAKLAVINAGPPSDVHPHPHPLTPQYFLAEMAEREDIAVVVTQRDFEGALRELTPSVSQAEMDHYAQVQARFSRKDDDVKEKGKGKQKAVAITA